MNEPTISRSLPESASLDHGVDGHTDATGNYRHNQDLSRRRAEAVKLALIIANPDESYPY